jgi:polysaccharide chain length determinant protein (PEP-CTERM system associated)
LKATPETLSVNSPLPATMDRSGTAISPRAQLAAATAKLKMLRTQYTENHPDVIRQKRLIASLKSQPSEDAAASGQDISNPAYVMLRSKLADADTEVAGHRNRLEETKKRFENAKKMASQAFTVQRDYQNLDRDYEVLHKNYEELLARRESAKITQAAGDQQSSVVFRVISPPAKPERPTSPNRLLLNSAVLFLGLGAGAALAFGLAQLSGTFLSMSQLKDAFELPILGAVTTVRTGREKAAAMRSSVVFAAGVGMLVAGCLAVLFVAGRVSGTGPIL